MAARLGAPHNPRRWCCIRPGERLRGPSGFGFERPGTRGLAKMQLRVTTALTALTIKLAKAGGRIRARQPEQLRSLVKELLERCLLAAYDEQRYPIGCAERGRAWLQPHASGSDVRLAPQNLIRRNFLADRATCNADLTR